MSNIVTAQPAPQTAAEYETMFERLMEEAGAIDEQMRRDRTDIERLKAETAVIREETRALLSDMGVKL